MKKVNSSSDVDANNGEVPKQKERHIVSWTQEEDDILREQIQLHGTENWAIIASKFKDKTTRQCRRRWFTYLNSDFKKGGWSPEEDMLLCEAQKMYGNRWTEIAKVVIGRTDNAVKNRFTTLCKKRAKREALSKENNTTCYINLNNKRVIFRNVVSTDGGSESVVFRKKTRSYISSIEESRDQGEKSAGDCGLADNLRHPFAVISQSFQSCEDNNIRRAFVKEDDPRVLALMQQAELLSSLAIKVNTENTDQSLENAWMVLQDFLEQNKESEQLTSRNLKNDFQVEKFKELAKEFRRCNEPDVYESSPASSEYSTGSSLLPSLPRDEKEECEAETSVLLQETGHALDSEQVESQSLIAERNAESTNEVTNMITCDDIKPGNGGACEYTNTEFRSPVHMTPLFRALAAAIPSPKFSESEKHFLMKTLGMESTSSGPVVHSSKTPSCKRSLLHCL